MRTPFFYFQLAAYSTTGCVSVVVVSAGESGCCSVSGFCLLQPVANKASATMPKEIVNSFFIYLYHPLFKEIASDDRLKIQ